MPIARRKRTSSLLMLASLSAKQKRAAPTSAKELHCAANLLILGLREGSKVEVFCHDRFWEASVEAVGGAGFYFTYDGSDDEFGFVYFDDFLFTWRLPMDDNQTHLTADNLAYMRDE